MEWIEKWMLLGCSMLFLSIFVLISSIVCCCCRKRRRRALISPPLVVTTATHQFPFTPGQPTQHTIIQSNQVPYPMGQHDGYAMPTDLHSYPMPQSGYHSYHSGVALYPPAGPQISMNPPSYEEVVGTTTTTTNDTYAKQAPNNPNFPG